MSAAVIQQELAAEFGPLPPCFLPVGGLPLYEHQLSGFPAGDHVFIAVPDTFHPTSSDARRLETLGASLVPLPIGLRLGEAIVMALNFIGCGDQAVSILHGDTLVKDLDWAALDVIAVGVEGDEYAWAEVECEGDRIKALRTRESGEAQGPERLIATGYFAFSSSRDFIRSMTHARYDFIEGINDYTLHRPLRPLSTGTWLDFGHLQTYFRARMIETTTRSFNELQIDGRTARKSSVDKMKIGSEASWYEAVPPAVKIFAARLLDAGSDTDRAFYTTVYEYLPSISELFVFCANGYPAWMRIMQACVEFLEACATCKGPLDADQALNSLVATKTMARLESFAAATGFDIHADLAFAGRPLPSLARIAENLVEAIDFKTGRRETCIHGDFCFSNILYDSRTRRIRVVDPRGHIDGAQTIFGDPRYDLAKFGHSVVGRYDQIISNRYRCDVRGRDYDIAFDEAPHHRWIQDAFRDIVIDGIPAAGRDVQAINATLFLSMLPLHADRPDRQRAFIANALRLYSEIEETTR